MNLLSLFISMLIIPVAFLCRQPSAQAQIRNEPEEIIQATPLSPFNERAGLWPSTELPHDTLNWESGSFADRFNSIPGVQAREAGSPTLSIRGSSAADRVLKLYEGIPLNLADGFGASDLFIPVETLGTLQLFKGPASVYYGTSAVGGALDHRLRIFERPAVKGSLADEGGMPGPRSALAIVPLRLTRSGSIPDSQLTLFHQRDPGQFLYRSTTGFGDGRRKNNAKETSRLTASHDFKSNSWSGRVRFVGARSIAEAPGSLKQPFLLSLTSSGALASATFSKKFSNRSSLSTRFSDLRVWTASTSSSSDDSSSTTRSSFSIDSNVMLTNQIGVRTFADLASDSFTATYSGNSHFYDRRTELGQSWEINASPTIALQPAYRYSVETGQFIKSLGLFHDDVGERVWMTYSEGYRNPSLTDRFANNTDSFGNAFVGNPSLSPERSRAVETGFLIENGKRYSGFLDGTSYGGTLYGIQYDNFIETRPLSATAITKTNSGEARALGFELNAAYGFSVWTFSASYNYLDAQSIPSHQPLRLAPKHQAALAISQQLGPVVMELRDTYWSQFYDFEFGQPSPREMPSWNTVDLNFWTIGINDWELKAGVLNIFNEARELTIGYPEPLRRFYVSALAYIP